MVQAVPAAIGRAAACSSGMLFGAGLLLLTDRVQSRGSSPARLFYRRAGILLCFGLLHAYLLWDGDILYSYALCGMVAYLVRRFPPWALLLLGVLALLYHYGTTVFFEMVASGVSACF